MSIAKSLNGKKLGGHVPPVPPRFLHLCMEHAYSDDSHPSIYLTCIGLLLVLLLTHIKQAVVQSTAENSTDSSTDEMRGAELW